MSDERTEQPTAGRLRKAREKGQLPRSRDLGSAAALFATVTVLAWLGDRMVATLTSAMKYALIRMGQSPLAEIDASEVAAMVISNAGTIGLIAGPVAFAAVVASVSLQTAQGGIVFATEALTLDLNRLNPAEGVKRLGFTHGGVELLKGLVSATVISILAWQAGRAVYEQTLGLARVGPVSAAQIGWNDVIALMRKAAIALVLLACVDYWVQRWRFMKSQRMTKEEVKQEREDADVSPEIKSRIRRIQFDLHRKRMMAAVPSATVVITNPTHYAVALEYTRGSVPAPRIVAKGRGFVALRIREIARDHNVPIVENPPLARALYAGAEVGDMIPGALFEAVAEVLAYLIRLKQLVL
jgi:flagellar biosynthetic protein FlhB